MGVIIRFRFYGYPCQSKVLELLRRLRYHAEYSESSLLLFTLEIFHLSALLIATWAFQFRESPFSFIVISCTIIGMGVFVIFHYLWLACIDYPTDCRQQNTNPPMHHRNIFPSVWRWLAPASDFPSSSVAFILI